MVVGVVEVETGASAAGVVFGRPTSASVTEAVVEVVSSSPSVTSNNNSND